MIEADPRPAKGPRKGIIKQPRGAYVLTGMTLSAQARTELEHFSDMYDLSMALVVSRAIHWLHRQAGAPVETPGIPRKAGHPRGRKRQSGPNSARVTVFNLSQETDAALRGLAQQENLSRSGVTSKAISLLYASPEQFVVLRRVL